MYSWLGIDFFFQSTVFFKSTLYWVKQGHILLHVNSHLSLPHSNSTPSTQSNNLHNTYNTESHMLINRWRDMPQMEKQYWRQGQIQFLTGRIHRNGFTKLYTIQNANYKCPADLLARNSMSPFTCSIRHASFASFAVVSSFSSSLAPLPAASLKIDQTSLSISSVLHPPQLSSDHWHCE